MDRVEQGEEIVITRHGRPVARLVPNIRSIDQSQVRAAFDRIRERAAQNKFGPFRLGEPQGRSRCSSPVSLVLDSSVTLAWFYADQRSDTVRHVFERLATGGAWVPSLWRLEVANILQMGVRRERHDIAFVEATLSDLALFPISLDPETDRRAWNATLQLARRHQLTFYDAAYLELAQRRGLPLAALDRELRTVATAERVDLLGP